GGWSEWRDLGQRYRRGGELVLAIDLDQFRAVVNLGVCVVMGKFVGIQRAFLRRTARAFALIFYQADGTYRLGNRGDDSQIIVAYVGWGRLKGAGWERGVDFGEPCRDSVIKCADAVGIVYDGARFRILNLHESVQGL